MRESEWRLEGTRVKVSGKPRYLWNGKCQSNGAAVAKPSQVR
jgi:hypothetical protein